MALPGPLLERIRDAILDAFPTAGDLTMALRVRLDLNFDALRSAGPYGDDVFGLVRRFDAEGRVGALLGALRGERPGNLVLRDAELAWRAEAPVVAPRLPARNARFVARGGDLRAVDERLDRGVVLALTGMPGVGKSALALQYVYGSLGRWRRVAWCAAATPVELLAGYAAQLGAAPAADGGDAAIQARATAFFEALCREQGWLLVLDDVASWEAIERWVPTGPNGAILLTATTCPHPDFAEWPVELLPADDAVRLLLGREVTGAAPLPAGAIELAERLGRLPLALARGRDLLARQRYSVAGLLDIVRKGRTTAALDVEPLRLATEQAVAETRRCDPRAAEALLATAFLHADAIPAELLASLCCPDDATAVWEVLGNVAGGLLRPDPDAGVVRVHALVQQILSGVHPDERAARASRVVDVVSAAFPDPGRVEHRAACERLRASAEACAAWVERLGLRTEPAARLLHRLAYYLDGQGFHFDVEPTYLRALALLSSLRPEDDPSVAELLNHVGWMYRAQGDLARAEAHYRRALAALERRADEEPRRLASALHNLATLVHERGRFEEALPMHERALAIRRREFGPDPKTALSLNNLAWLLADLGRLDEADALLDEALRIGRERLPGDGDHPNVATTLALGAHVLRRRGRRAEARERYREALAMRERHLGSSHPRIASIVNELGELELEDGDADEAARHFARAEALLTALKLDRVADAAWWRRGRARLAARRGERDEALRWYREALARARDALSAEHPEARELAEELAAYESGAGV